MNRSVEEFSMMEFAFFPRGSFRLSREEVARLSPMNWLVWESFAGVFLHGDSLLRS